MYLIYVPASMTMSVMFILALKIIFVPFASTDGGIPSVMCTLLGVESEYTHKWPIKGLPDRCKAILFGAYYFNKSQSQENIAAISDLVNSNHQVFMFLAGETFWNDILTSDKYDNEIANMATFLTQNKICGIILNIYKEVYDLDIDDKATKINNVVGKIKATATNVIVGLTVDASQSNMFPDETLFCFNTANAALDMYFIFTGDSGLPCWAKTADVDRFPIDLVNEHFIGLDSICQNIVKSKMKKEKVIFSLVIAVGVGKDNETLMGLEYPEYCELKTHKKLEAGTTYCPDSIDIYKKRAIHVKSYSFKGLCMGHLDYDYWYKACNVSEYAITNAMIDGWES